MVWGGGLNCFQDFFSLCHSLFTKFQFPTMPATGQKVCGGGGGVVWWWLRPTLVFSLAKAEQNPNPQFVFD